MKIQCFYDLHCRDLWKNLVDMTSDKILFGGDYLDSFIHSNEEMLNNFADIIEFKKQNVDKVELLIGNHEIFPFGLDTFPCSGYRPEVHFIINELYQKNKKYFKIAYQYKNHLFTHAGLSETVWGMYTNEVNKLPIDTFNGSYADWLNLAIDKASLMKILIIVGKLRGGKYRSGGVFWCDKAELYKDGLESNIIQYVGHTPIDDIFCYKEKEKEKYWFLDIFNKNPDKQVVFNL